MRRLTVALALTLALTGCGGDPTGICYRPQVLAVDTLRSVSPTGDTTTAIVIFRVCGGNGTY